MTGHRSPGEGLPPWAVALADQITQEAREVAAELSRTALAGQGLEPTEGQGAALLEVGELSGLTAAIDVMFRRGYLRRPE